MDSNAIQLNLLQIQTRELLKAIAVGGKEEIANAARIVSDLIPTPQVKVPTLKLRDVALLAPKDKQEQALTLAVAAESAMEATKKLTELAREAGDEALIALAKSVDAFLDAKTSAETVAAADIVGVDL